MTAVPFSGDPLMLDVGSTAPSFSLEDKEGKKHALADMKEPFIIVYFYPKDNTPGCTIQAKKFTAKRAAFKRLGATIVGISGGDRKSKQAFCEAQELDVLLLSDTDLAVSKAYGVYGKKKFMGKEFMGIKRTTFVLGKDRVVLRVFHDVKPEMHIDELLSYVRTLQ